MTSHDAFAQRLSLQNQTLVRNLTQKFMADFQVPGLSIAISKNGKMVLSTAFGIAEKESSTAVTTSHRFRIASVSKPITSIGIHHLILQRKLSYADRVFGAGSLLGDDFGGLKITKDLEQITVEHLLTHTAGGWGNQHSDPMFMQTQLEHDDLIRWTLENQPLENVPGTSYAYSNFGYCLLGRITERLSGQSYDDFIVGNITKPAGLSSFAISRNNRSDRLPMEVTYYGQGSERPYAPNVERMDSHGGWIATASDLVRLAMLYDGFSRPADRLSPVLLRQMTTPSLANQGYAKGWSVNKSNNWWHMGSLPGTGSILVRTSSGFCWSVLVNTRSKNKGFNKALDQLPWDIVNGIGSRK